MNTCALIGKVTEAVTLKKTVDGQRIAFFEICVPCERNKKNDCIRILAFNQVAEMCAKNLVIGQRVGVVGRIQSASYITAYGKKVYETEIIVAKIDFLSHAKNEIEDAAAACELETINDLRDEVS